MNVLIWIVGGYLLGSIPFGVAITYLFGLGNLREIGSGNIGATNVLRTGHKGAALATLMLDGTKGAIAVLLARYFGGETAGIIAGTAAFFGHCYPVWLGFRGGKGVATFLGTLIALLWPAGLIACIIWALVAVLSRISSLSALVSAGLSPVVAMLFDQPEVGVAAFFMAVLIFFRHSANISRLLNGTEPRIGK